MGKFMFQAVIGLAVVGTIFCFGVVVGGGFANDVAEIGVQSRIVDCLPLETAQELEACLAQPEDAP
ncbi:MAG: hypothetical protein L0H93_18060 [Nocardioides sp.]|nr:hypothetical protein [Nocardioides sp.]